MIFSPIPGTPLITQGFAQNPDIYRQFGFIGHNGIDFELDIGTTVYAPHDGIAEIHDDGDEGYGLYLVITTDKRKSILGHLQEVFYTEGQFIHQGNPVAKSGNSGFSSNPHLHWTFKILHNGVVQNRNNGFEGAIDVTEFTRLWLDQDMHFDSNYTDFASEYLTMTFLDSQYLKNTTRHA